MKKNNKYFGKTMSLFLVMLMLCSVLGGLKIFATSDLIFHSGYEPSTVGIPKTGDEGTISDLSGTDNTFSSNNNWGEFDSIPGIGTFSMQYQNLDNSHMRYANVVDDPTNILFQDNFDDSYDIGNAPHKVTGDFGKRNWNLYTTSNAQITVQADPLNSANQVMQVKSLGEQYPRLEKSINVPNNPQSGRILINYKIMNLTRTSYIDIIHPLVTKGSAISIYSTTASAGGSYKYNLNSNGWTDVSLDVDFINNRYSATVNGDTFAKDKALFSTAQTDFSNIKIRFNSSLANGSYYYLDDVNIKQTEIKFEDGFDLNYTIGNEPHKVSNDKGIVSWSNFTANSTNTNISVAQDPIDSNNKAMKVTVMKTTTDWPKLDKNLDMSQTQRMTIEYKVMSKSRNSYIDIDLPSVTGSTPRTNVVKFQNSSAYVDTTPVAINPDVWTKVRIDCDLYNNTYNAYIGDSTTPLGGTQQLFSTKQTDFRNIRVRFNSAMSNNAYYFLDDVKIINTPNKILKYYGGRVVNDGKLRVQSALSDNGGQMQYYFKERIYIGEGFETLKTAGQDIPGYWLTLAEFMDGSDWNYVPDPIITNKCSRVSVGIADPTTYSDPLRFSVEFQITEDHLKAWKYPKEWEYVSDGTNGTGNIAVPIGKWVTMEYYLKQGLGANGKFEMYMTTDDGVRTKIFDIADDTYKSIAVFDGYEHAFPQKLYGTKELFNSINAANADLQIYWDDFEMRTDKP